MSGPPATQRLADMSDAEIKALSPAEFRERTLQELDEMRKQAREALDCLAQLSPDPEPSDPFEAEVAQLLKEEKSSAEFDRLMAKTQFLSPADLICLWMVANGAMPKRCAPLVRLEKVAITQLCARTDLLREFGGDGRLPKRRLRSDAGAVTRLGAGRLRENNRAAWGNPRRPILKGGNERESLGLVPCRRQPAGWRTRPGCRRPPRTHPRGRRDRRLIRWLIVG